MPYICKIRTDIPDGILQVLDLTPNSSQRNLIYEPAGQTKYVRRVENDAVVTISPGATDITAVAYTGVSAYLIDHVEGGGLAAGTAALPDADLVTISAAIISAMDAGTAMGLAAVNALISATVANSELTSAGGSASTGSLAELLRVLAGAEYLLPASSITESPTGTFDPTVAGAFTAGVFRQTYQTGSLEISIGEGHLFDFIQATFSYGGTAGAALVVYDEDGTVMT